MSLRLASLALTSVVFVSACGGSANETTVLRLVDRFPSASVTGAVVMSATSEPTEWRFGEGSNSGWKAGAGVWGSTSTATFSPDARARPFPSCTWSGWQNSSTLGTGGRLRSLGYVQ